MVLTTSAADDRDVQQMYDLRCSSYIVRPLDLDDFEQAVRLICGYWLVLATLPSAPP